MRLMLRQLIAVALLVIYLCKQIHFPGEVLSRRGFIAVMPIMDKNK